MRIRTITVQDRIYRIIVIVGVLVVTIISFSAFFFGYDQLLPLISLLYAFILFMIGAYNSNMDKKKDGVYFTRRYQYYSLRKLHNLFEDFLKQEMLSYNRFFNFTILHQSCTRRLSQENLKFQHNIKIDDLIELDGIKYKKDFLDMEKKILSYNESIKIKGVEQDSNYKLNTIKYRKLIYDCYLKIKKNMKLIEKYYGDRLINDVNRNDFEKNTYYTLIKQLSSIEKSVNNIDFDYSQIHDIIVPVVEANFEEIQNNMYEEFSRNDINQEKIFDMVKELVERRDEGL